AMLPRLGHCSIGEGRLALTTARLALSHFKALASGSERSGRTAGRVLSPPIEGGTWRAARSYDRKSPFPCGLLAVLRGYGRLRGTGRRDVSGQRNAATRVRSGQPQRIRTVFASCPRHC